MPEQARASAHSTTTAYRVDLSDPQGHEWHADEPADKGGADTAPAPMQLLLSALGACTTVTLQMYATRKQWPLTEVKVELALNATEAGKTGNDIVRTVTLVGDLDDEQRKRLLAIAEACPVHKLLTGDVRIATSLG